MIKLLTIIGARPQIIKASAISRAVRTSFNQQIQEVIIHTGQHYDDNMSKVFFEEMEIPAPDYNLGVGSGTHGVQTARMINGLEEVFFRETPRAVLVYGDTNSTLAAAVTASKMHIPLIHVEAGLRSFNKAMPEEVNRIVCDHLSTLLFTPTKAGLTNLLREGFSAEASPPFTADNPAVFLCGDVMYDNSLYFASMASQKSSVIQRLKVQEREFILVTIHRDGNTDDSERMQSIITALLRIIELSGHIMVLPLHPRTKRILQATDSFPIYKTFLNHPKLLCIPPVSFFDMISLEKNSSLIITDSGGVQKESYFYNKPCIILRPQTEWVEIVEKGSAILADANTDRIIEAYKKLSAMKKLDFPLLYGDGKASEFICEQICKLL